MSKQTKAIVHELNTAIGDFFDEKLSTDQLMTLAHKIDSPDIRDSLTRKGYYVVCVMLDKIHELSYYQDKSPDMLKSHLSNLKKYYDETKMGTDPRYTRLSFKYSYHTPSFIIEVDVNPNN